MAQETIFQTEGVFHRYMHYTHVSFLFCTERDYSNIHIRLDYDPLFCEAGEPELRQAMRDALKDQIYRTDEPYVTEKVDKAFPIKNQISVAVRGPQGWLGEHHAFDGGDSITLGPDASVGFFRAPCAAGQYEIVLHVFAVYTPDCRYSVKITGEVEQ